MPSIDGDLQIDENGDLKLVDGMPHLLNAVVDRVTEEFTKQLQQVDDLIAQTMLNSAPTSLGASYGSSFGATHGMSRLEHERNAIRKKLARYMELHMSPMIVLKMPRKIRDILKRKPSW